MKTKSTILGLIAASGVLLSGCDVSDPIYDTPHHERGQITLTTDWSNIGAGITKPTNCTADIGAYCVTLTSDCHTVDNLFLPGTYHTNVYNTAEKITVSSTTATVATVTTPAGETGTFIDPLPGWLFTWAGDQQIEKDTDYDIIATMQQQVRELNLLIEPTGSTVSRIVSVTGTLSGVASQLNLDNGTASTSASIVPVFTKETTGADAGKYKATVRLFGITGSVQNLKVTLTFADGSPADLTTTTNIATQLTGFNSDKRTPMILGAQSTETPIGAGFTATITDWTVRDSAGTAK